MIDKEPIARLLEERLRNYATARATWEAIWRFCWSRYTSEFLHEMSQTEGEGGRSDANSGMSRRKVKIFTSHVTDLLFGSGKMPFDLKNTPVPDYAIAGPDGMNAGQIPGMADDDRVDGMRRLIQDQLVEGKFSAEAYKLILQMGIFGSGGLEGPVIEMRRRVQYVPVPIAQDQVEMGPDGQPDPRSLVPTMSFERKIYDAPAPMYRFRDLWDIYPDLTREDPQEGEGIFVVDEMTEAELAALATIIDANGNPKYERESIQAVLNCNDRKDFSFDRGPHRQRLYENDIDGEKAGKTYEVITYHGKLSVADLDGYYSDQPDQTDDEGNRPLEHFIGKEVIITFCRGYVLRMEENTNPKGHRQIKIAPIQSYPGSPYGLGICWELKDCEKAFNHFLRLMIDNKRMAGMPDKIIDRERIENADELPDFGREYKVIPGAGAEGAVQYITYPDVSENILSILAFIEQWANAASNLPAFLEGDDVQTTSNTAYEVSELKTSAMKMLALTMQSLDSKIIIPSVEDLYFWNMEYGEDDTLKGDFEVHATGQQSFRDNVVVAQEVIKFLQIAGQNEQMSAEIDYAKAIKLMSRTSQAGIEDLIKTPEKKAEEAKQAQEAQQAAMQAQQQAFQMQLDAKLKEITAKAEADMQKLTAKAEADMAMLQEKLGTDKDKAILGSEDKRLANEDWRRIEFEKMAAKARDEEKSEARSEA